MVKLKRARSRSRSPSLDREQSGGNDDAGSASTSTSTSKCRNGHPRLRFKQHQHAPATPVTASSTTSSTAATHRGRGAAPVAPVPWTILPTLPTLEGSLAEEIVLRCLSYLDVHDVLKLATVSSGWCRLTHDNQLWKQLYTRTYTPSATSHTSSTASFSRSWKDLYKISFNWRRGHARTSVLRSSVRKAVLPPLPLTIDEPNHGSHTTGADTETPLNRPHPRVVRPFAYPPTATARSRVSPNSALQSNTLVQFYRNIYFLGSRSTHPSSVIPPVQVQQALPDGSTILLGEIISSNLLASYQQSSAGFTPAVSITSIQLDEAPNTSIDTSHQVELAVFLSTGQFSLFSVTLPNSTAPFEWQEVHTSPLTTASTKAQSFDPVVLARYHGSLLATCSRSFVMRFYHVIRRPAAGTFGGSLVIEASDRLQTTESWAPVSLSLEKLPDPFASDTHDHRKRSKASSLPQAFKLVLAYATPIFPDSWSVGVQQFEVTLTPHHDALNLSGIMIKSQHAVARLAAGMFASPTYPHLSSSRASLVTAIEHLGDHVVISRADNTLDVYLLTADPKTEHLGIQHIKTLFGHTARVSSLALVPGTGDRVSATAPATSSTMRTTREHDLRNSVSAGHVVSASEDGKVKIWALGPPRQHSKRSTGVVPSAPIDVTETGRTSLSFDESKDRAQGVSTWVQLASKRSQRQRETVLRVALDMEKIVTVVRRRRRPGNGDEADGEEEMIRVLRFD
ncbi:BQ5605_C046g12281 [Microbotryum silenes-dioicae]|uniref:BQ5605_C046g12281 protein n=1 Tax=Microbotryum silenes-dioicae TaxID=796604 RepID=A0A2X0MSV8_9BASI|nr:BQ5605_C046g12281 [Microbotryum silenes-dioicae]